MFTVEDIKWKNNIVTGEVKARKPGLFNFINCAKAIELLHEHLAKNANIAVHCDVDVDGIGSGYIVKQFLSTQTFNNQTYIINKDKIHGIQQKHVDFFKGKPLDLLIIVDSSSNELDIIKQFECDVIVVDHHEVDHDSLYGYTNDNKHRYIMVNNTIGNSDTNEIKCLINKNSQDTSENIDEYIADDRMSCGLVVYELLRLYCYTYGIGHIMENKMLYQWVGVTLFTDAIQLNNERNQWYIENTIHNSGDMEHHLKILMNKLNTYKVALDKSFISYTLAPCINGAIRAGESGQALDIVLYRPMLVTNLGVYKEKQAKAVSDGINDVKQYDTYITKDISNTEIHKNYNGVIASRLCGDFNKNCVVYRVIDGYADGSFRGRISGTDYLSIFKNHSETSWAQGHKSAFGFKCLIEELDSIMKSLTQAEVQTSSQLLLTAGKINEVSPGIYAIDDIEEFKRQGGIWKLGIGNSKVSSDEQILLTVGIEDVQLLSHGEKLSTYNILGLNCKAFKPVNFSSKTVNVYVEYSRQIDCYIK